MFFILAESRDGGQTWHDNFETTYATGAEAQASAKRFNENAKCRSEQADYMRYMADYKWRVRRVLNTDDDNFYAREAAKNLKPIDFEFRDNDYSYRLAHFDPDDKTFVRFFDSLDNAHDGRYTRMKLSRFLMSYLDENEDEVTNYLVKIGYYKDSYEFHITQDADKIQQVYEDGPNSCMNDEDEYPLPSPHPARVYAGPDLAVAYITRGNGYTARAVVYPAKKIFLRLYGHTKLLEEELKKNGYRRTEAKSTWDGARIQKIWDENADLFIVPYLDMSPTVRRSRCGNYLRLSGDRGSLSSQNCDGYADTNY